MINLLTNNLLGILIATAAAMVIGGIWYSKPVFGKDWQKLVGLKDKDMKQRMAQSMAVMLLMALVTAVVLQRFIVIANPQNYVEALKLGVWLWLGFVAVYALGYGALEKQSTKLVIINITNQLITILVMSVILFATYNV
jgi:hypothetical protein